MKVINTVIKLGESPSLGLESQKLAVTRDPAGPFKASEELEIGLDVKEVTVRAVRDCHVYVSHSVVNADGLESVQRAVRFQAGGEIAPALTDHPQVSSLTEQDEPVGASEQLGVLSGSIKAAGEEETTDGSATETNAGEAAATEGGNPEDTSNVSLGAATGDESEVDSDSKEN